MKYSIAILIYLFIYFTYLPYLILIINPYLFRILYFLNYFIDLLFSLFTKTLFLNFFIFRVNIIFLIFFKFHYFFTYFDQLVSSFSILYCVVTFLVKYLTGILTYGGIVVN